MKFEQHRDDVCELGALGYAQELFRTMGGFSNFALSFSIISILTVILAIPDNMRAGKTILSLTVALSAWYLLAERHRYRGPAWSTQAAAPPAS